MSLLALSGKARRRHELHTAGPLRWRTPSPLALFGVGQRIGDWVSAQMLGKNKAKQAAIHSGKPPEQEG